MFFFFFLVALRGWLDAFFKEKKKVRCNKVEFVGFLLIFVSPVQIYKML